MKAIWNGKTIAESKNTIFLEGNQYFPPESIKKQYFIASEFQTVCAWKGTASYYNLIVDGEMKQNAGWYYPEPSEKAKEIKNHVAFDDGVIITK